MLRQEGVETFERYCGSSPDLGCKDFAKLCRDCDLVGPHLGGAEVDLIFTSVLPKGQRRIQLRQFEDALRLVADKISVPAGEICGKVEESKGPILHGTKADAVRFHDDRRTYTGTHLYGGPATGSKGKGSSVNQEWLLTLRVDHDESPSRRVDSPVRGGESPRSDSRGNHMESPSLRRRSPPARSAGTSSPRPSWVRTQRLSSVDTATRSSESPARRTDSPTRCDSPFSPRRHANCTESALRSQHSMSARSVGPSSPRPARVRTQRQNSDHGVPPAAQPREYYPSLGKWGRAVEEAFRAYCGVQPGMDATSFLKLCKDCGLLDRKFTSTEADLLFVKTLPKGLRRIDLRWFQHLIWHVAEKKSLNAEAIFYAIACLSGPSLVSTKADAVRLHDDKSTYTGTHSQGGPDVGPVARRAPAPGLWSGILRPEAEIDMRPKAGRVRDTGGYPGVRRQMSAAKLHRTPRRSTGSFLFEFG
eukprot:TRINITY_DN61745_c0_g1_i1.p1 TRINITY_DN61745_c0_g1~~TRINITY_DN61745_c0_g1_i1.p1  ORF type:complete len:475 (-),score=50.94 TRINITY_DN61745_c0_g1_i1:187-1611(-)